MNMTKTSRITRRQFLQLSALTGTSLIAAACAAPAVPTPAAPTTAPVPPAATSAATAAATSAATRAATAPPAPGTNLIGTLEGPAVLTDAAKIPAAFKEAP